MAQPVAPLCRLLRWKGRDREPGGPTTPRGYTLTCLATSQPWGPDDRPASADTCGPDRSCYSNVDRSAT
jgi:hypothetical protein